jgi:hypothetical protein
MGGGTSDGTNQANGQVNFAPSMGGGNVAIYGNIGNGPVNQQMQNSASGASTSLDFKMSMPEMPGMPGAGGAPAALVLMNLDNHVATLKTDGTANFNGGGAGSNTVDNMWSTAGSSLNFGL